MSLKEREALKAAPSPTIPTSVSNGDGESENSKVSASNQVEQSAVTRESTEPPLDREEIEERRETCLARLNDLFAKVDDRRRVSPLS